MISFLPALFFAAGALTAQMAGGAPGPVFAEQTPALERPYRTVRWGKGVQLWLVEGRDFVAIEWSHSVRRLSAPGDRMRTEN